MRKGTTIGGLNRMPLMTTGRDEDVDPAGASRAGAFLAANTCVTVGESTAVVRKSICFWQAPLAKEEDNGSVIAAW